jgi:uncharacterized protein
MRTDWQLVELDSGRTVVPRLQLADTFWSRLVGWQFRRSPGEGHGLLVTPCGSIHTCFLRFALDVVMLDRAGRIVGTRRGLRPWRIVIAPRGTQAVLEIPSPGPDLTIGTTLRLRSSLQIRAPKHLRFLELLSPADTTANSVTSDKSSPAARTDN